MLVTLIPLFLAANISVLESDWKYGPEVIYDVKINSMLQFHRIPSNVTDNTEHYLKWGIKLTCREKSRLVLSCHINLLENKDLEKFNFDSPSKGPCELHFGHHGLQEIVCSSPDPMVLDTVRAVADQLNFGADLTTILYDTFDVMENSTTGKCKTKYVMTSSWVNPDDDDGSSSSSSEESDEEDTDNYEIVIVPGMHTLTGQVMEIKKSRYLKDCRHQYHHVFAITQGDNEDIPRIFYPHQTKINSSESHMTIRENGFISYTEKVFDISDSRHPAAITLKEVITVKLEKIVAAKGPLPSIQYPATDRIFPKTWILSGDSK